MKKRTTLIATSLVCVGLLTLCGCNNSANDKKDKTDGATQTDALLDEHNVSDQLCFVEENDHIVITGFDSGASCEELVIPETINNLPVTHIGENAFQGNLDITKVTLPDSVTTIMAHAFDDCANIKEVSMSSNLQTIEEGAFFCCLDLADVDFPDSLTTIGKGAFYSCTSFENIILPDSLMDMADHAFYGCENVTNLTLGSSLTQINAMTFDGCTGLSSITIPDNISIIGENAFANCSSLESVTLPAELEEIGDKAFNGCAMLNNLTVNARRVGEEAFALCSSLNNLELGDNVEYLGSGCLRYTAIQTIQLPSSVSELGDGAFKSMISLETFEADDNPNFTVCDDMLYSADMKTLYGFPSGKMLAEVSLDPSTVTVKSHAFEDCNVEKIITNQGLEVIEERAFCNCMALSDIQLSNTIKTIDKEAFFGCTSLLSLTIPESVEDINPGIDTETYLESILVDENNEKYTSVDGVVFSKDKKELIVFPNGKPGESYNIPDGTEKICKEAFRGNYIERSVTVPATVNTIEEFGISDVKSVSFLGDVKTLDDYAVGYGTVANIVGPFTNFMIIGEIGSPMEKYAMDNNFAFATDTPALNSESVSLAKDETFKLTLSNTNPEYISFFSSDSNIASVDADGVITGVGKGQTSIIVVNGGCYSICNVEVTSGEEVVPPTSDYFSVTADNFEEWEAAYHDANINVSEDPKYNKNLVVYTGGEFVPIVAAQEGEIYPYYEQATSGYDLTFYKMIGDDLNLELSRSSLHENTILYSGTDATEISRYTQTGASIEDMINSIGTVTTHDEVISTSLSHKVATNFGNYMLEIYAPASVTKGAYIKNFSMFPDEYELLLASGQKFEVIGAGIRLVMPTGFDNSEAEEPHVEKYLQLQIVE